MKRSIATFLALLVASVVLAAPAPEPFRSGWEKDINPDRDCKFIRDKDAFTIELPGTVHDYDPLPKRMNAPRLLREVEGDFVIQARIRIIRRPSGESTVEGQLSSVAAGFLLIPPDTSHVTCIRFEFGVARKGREEEAYYAWKHRDDQKGQTNALFTRGYGNWTLPEPTEPAYLRLARRSETLYLSMSLDGKKWTQLMGGARYIGLPAKLKVGLAAYSTSTEPTTARFDEFKLIRGQKKKE